MPTELRRFSDSSVAGSLTRSQPVEPSSAEATRNRKCLLGLTPGFEHRPPIWRASHWRHSTSSTTLTRNRRKCMCRPFAATGEDSDRGHHMKRVALEQLPKEVAELFVSAQHERVVVHARRDSLTPWWSGMANKDEEDLQLESSLGLLADGRAAHGATRRAVPLKACNGSSWRPTNNDCGDQEAGTSPNQIAKPRD